ncbi:MAG: hypothetical protein NTY74_14675 [Ignavibacteriae bacterium]|nr:hypothetical protein [Ignavibacteriota bacterium]
MELQSGRLVVSITKNQLKSNNKNIMYVKTENTNLFFNQFKHLSINEEDKKETIKKLKCSEGECKRLNGPRKKYQFLPNSVPINIPVKHFFICQEPSFSWASSKNVAKKLVEKGLLNFIGGGLKKKAKEKYILNNIELTSNHLSKIGNLHIMYIAIKNCFGDDSFYMTDLSKCAMPVKHTKIKQGEGNSRYECCKSLLCFELSRLTDKDTIVYQIGDFEKDMFNKNGSSDKYENISDVFSSINKNRFEILPHYAITISCPEFILESIIRNSNGEISKEGLKDEIWKGYLELYSGYLKNMFCLTDLTSDIIENVNAILKEQKQFGISDTSILLYYLFKDKFSSIKAKPNIN